MREAVIVEAVRTPMGKGKPGGALSGLHAVDLLGQTLSGGGRRGPADDAERADPGDRSTPRRGDRVGSPARGIRLCEAGGMANATVIERL